METAKDFEVLVVGGGPAGCAAAFDLAAAGIEVAVLETRTFPRVKPCGGALTIKAVRALRFSIDPVARNVVTDFVAGREFTRETRFRGRYPIGVMTVREDLDHFVLQKTVEAGATLIKVQRLARIEVSDEAVKIETDIGCFRAKFLIGADGANSTVRRLTGEHDELGFGFAIEGQVPLRSAQERAMTFDFGVVPRGYGWMFPKGDHYNVGIYTYDARFRLFPAQLRSYLREKLARDDLTHVVGQAIGIGGWNHELRSRRVFLVGDAGGFCEPVLGEGIFYAIRSGQIAAAAVIDEQRHRRRADEAFRKRLRYLRSDLCTAGKLAKRFYRDLGVGYLALTSPLLRYALMKGFALGVPLGHIPSKLVSFPLRRVEPVPWLGGRV